MERRRKKIGNYFHMTPNLKFVSTGCPLLDCVLGGGYPLGRIVNIVGDRSSGKTLLAIESTVNFYLRYPEGKVYYHEVEAAFDKDYARNLGMPVDKIDFVEESYTVESLFRKLEDITKDEDTSPKLYILDSLDALSDEAELGREIEKGSYGAEKAKKLSEMFRRITGRLASTNTLLIIISQVRDKIGVVFGAKHSRSGGKALDFYASQVLWLSEVKKLKKTVRKTERPIGIEVKAKCKKNKVSLPYRECTFPIRFGYGIEDIPASLAWLKSIGGLEPIWQKADLSEKSSLRSQMKWVLLSLENKKFLDDLLLKTWLDLEKEFLPKTRKYS